MPEEQSQPQSNQPQVQAPQTNSISWSKVILTILAIVIVVGLIAGGLWYFVLGKSESSETGSVKVTTPTKQSTPSSKKATESAQKDETEGWKVFNFEFKDKKFSFKYPEDWVVEKTNADVGLVEYVLKKGQNKIEFISNRGIGWGDGDSSDEIIKEILVGFESRKVKSAEHVGKYYGVSYYVHPQNADNLNFIFQISSENSNLTAQEKSEMFEIVSTFKLID